MTYGIWLGFIFGISLSAGIVIGRYRAKRRQERLIARRRRIEEKLKHRAELQERLQKVFKDIEEYRENLHQTTFRYFEFQEAGDSAGENTCTIRGNIVVEQIESYMALADELLEEIEEVDDFIEVLENES